MTAEDNRRLQPSTRVSPFDLQLSACVIEGHPDGRTQPPERRRNDRRRAQESVSSNPVRLAVGELLGGRYRIERELGEGGMGVVYLAADEQVHGERFAIKVLKEELRPEALALLREEVRKTRKLSHPNIVDVHSVNVDGQKLYVLMEYLEGKSLDRLLDEEFGRGMPFSHAWPIIEDVGAALGNAHDHNVIHSDLKPANVFLTTSGRTKLLDFGIARVSRGPLLHASSGPRALTPGYASCEMLEGKEADRRDDIYSFACVIYEMLCGERPFGELTALEAREAGTRVPPVQGLSREQNAALAQALRFDRDGRTASVEKLLVGLAERRPRSRPRVLLGPVVIAVVAVMGLTYWVLDRPLLSKHSVVVHSAAPDTQQAGVAVAVTASFNPPPHSIAVLPFVNMSAEKEQEYFSDGVTEEVLNSLSRINELHVAARTSSFSFKGKEVDLGTVARKLNVGAILEGSVRRSQHTVRITAQLNNAVTGFNIWSQTYDRDLGDVLKLQTEIAESVSRALRLTLLGDVAARIELGGTRNSTAFDAYLRGWRAYYAAHNGEDMNAAIASFSEAIRRDSNYALAFAGRSVARVMYADNFATGAASRDAFDKALADAKEAIGAAPQLGEAHLAMAFVQEVGFLDFPNANEEYERALAIAPGNVRVLGKYSTFASAMGRPDDGVATARRAVALDPLNPFAHAELGETLLYARRYDESIAAFQDALALYPELPFVSEHRGLAYYALDKFQEARSSCDVAHPTTDGQMCLAISYEKLNQRADAEAALARIRTSPGTAKGYACAVIFAQWGETAEALSSLETAVRLRDSNVERLKVDPLLDPLRNEPRFQVIKRKLKFPN
nr:serine/threonine-protein kinase PknD [uncultured bacterium]